MVHSTANQLRNLIYTLNYVASIHALEELADEDTYIHDLENIIFSGQITEFQRGRQTQEVKYLVSGQTLNSRPTQTIAIKTYDH